MRMPIRDDDFDPVGAAAVRGEQVQLRSIQIMADAYIGDGWEWWADVPGDLT